MFSEGVAHLPAAQQCCVFPLQNLSWVDLIRRKKNSQLRSTESLRRSRTAVSSVCLAMAVRGPLQLDSAHSLPTPSVVMSAGLASAANHP